MQRSKLIGICLSSLFFQIFNPQLVSAKLLVIDQLEAAVNDAIILKSDASHFKKTAELRQQLDPIYAQGELAKNYQNVSNQKIIDFLMNEKLIETRFVVKDPEVEQEINSIQATNGISRQELKEALQNRGYRFKDYFQLIRSSIAKKNLIDRDIRTKVFIGEDDIKNYFYNQLPKSARASLSYRIGIITISRENYKTTSAAKQTAQRALKALRSGEEFEEVSRRFSDHSNASNGGDLGFLKDNEISPLIRDEIKKLRVGQTSGILGNQDSNYFLLKLIDIQSGQSDEYENRKESIRNLLTSKEYRRQIKLWLNRERQNASIHLKGEAL